MNDGQLQTVERVRGFLEGSEAVEFRGLTAQGKYCWVEEVLIRFKYHRLKRGEKGVIHRYIEEVTGYSRSQVSRLIAEYKRTGRFGERHPFTTTKPGSLLKSSIPVRTFTDWEENRPGFLEVDLVSHCGESTEGFYLTTLSTVDVASGRSECVGVWGKGQERVGGAVHKIRQRLPFPPPYQRLLKAGILTEAKRRELAVTYHSLNPVTLLKKPLSSGSGGKLEPSL